MLHLQMGKLRQEWSHNKRDIVETPATTPATTAPATTAHCEKGVVPSWFLQATFIIMKIKQAGWTCQ